MGYFEKKQLTNGGTVVSDGETYELYRKLLTNKDWIKGGIGDFWQYLSVRTPRKSTGSISGTITFQNHVNAWRSNGWNLDDFIYYQAMESGGYESNGNANITIASTTTSYNVSCNANGGSGSVPVYNTAYSSGAAVPVMGQGGLTRSGTAYAAGSTFSITSNVTLYMQQQPQTPSGTVVCAMNRLVDTLSFLMKQNTATENSRASL